LNWDFANPVKFFILVDGGTLEGCNSDRVTIFIEEVAEEVFAIGTIVKGGFPSIDAFNGHSYHVVLRA